MVDGHHRETRSRPPREPLEAALHCPPNGRFNCGVPRIAGVILHLCAKLYAINTDLTTLNGTESHRFMIKMPSEGFVMARYAPAPTAP